MAGHTNGATTHDLAPRGLPPYEAGKAYTLKSLEGEIIYIPCSKSAMRLLVTGKETEGAFALVGTGGSLSPPIGFHFHREAHDVFLCLKGSANVWQNDQCRTLLPGDLASVPPGVIHQYQILGDHSEFIGLIIPGGWEDFFRFIGEPYAGPMWPLIDERNPFEVLIPKLKAAVEKFDMIPQPHHPSCDPQAWDGSENVLPGKLAPYYLRANQGPKKLLEGLVVKPMVSTKESAGKFVIGSLEGSSYHQNPTLRSKLRFSETHHALYIMQGQLDVVIDGSSSTVQALETMYIPKGSVFSLGFKARYVTVYVFSNGPGLIELLYEVGKEYSHAIAPEKEDASMLDTFRQLSSSYGCEVVA